MVAEMRFAFEHQRELRPVESRTSRLQACSFAAFLRT